MLILLILIVGSNLISVKEFIRKSNATISKTNYKHKINIKSFARFI